MTLCPLQLSMSFLQPLVLFLELLELRFQPGKLIRVVIGHASNLAGTLANVKDGKSWAPPPPLNMQVNF